jgi:hypothetical protein
MMKNSLRILKRIVRSRRNKDKERGQLTKADLWFSYALEGYDCSGSNGLGLYQGTEYLR